MSLATQNIELFSIIRCCFFRTKMVKFGTDLKAEINYISHLHHDIIKFECFMFEIGVSTFFIYKM